jgi:NADPH:quinone reductase-like Zn-dependent oxidoreductase
MRAAVRYDYGPPDIVRLEEVEKPVPGEGEILVRVHVASVNRADLDGITPRPAFVRLALGIRRPRSPRIGLDAAGVVEAVGAGVTRFMAGDRVYADLFAFGAGAFADYVAVPERAFALIPAGMTIEDAATLPHSAVLAVQGLRRGGRTIQPGDQVLIDGASGNVGPFAVQIAKARGAVVTGVCSAEKVDFVRSLGADQVIDYRAEDYTKLGRRYDWIVDTDSHHPILRVRRALKPNGVYVTLGGTSWPILGGLILGPLVSLFSDRWSGLLLWWKPFNRPDVATIEALLASGDVKPAIDRRYPLSQVVDALRYVDEGRAKGKVVLEIAETA